MKGCKLTGWLCLPILALFLMGQLFAILPPERTGNFYVSSFNSDWAELDGPTGMAISG